MMGSHREDDGYDDSGDNDNNNRSRFKIAGGDFSHESVLAGNWYT